MDINKSLARLIAVFSITLFALATQLTAKPITVAKMPANAEEFVKLRDSLANTPEGGAVIFILAMLKYSEDKAQGLQFMTIALSQNHLSKGEVYKGFKPASSLNFHMGRFDNALYWPRGYIKGTKPDDGYQYTWPVTFELTRNKYSGEEKSGTVKVFVDTFGVSPRPMTLKANDKGIWKAHEFSSFFLPVQSPKSADNDDL